MPASATHQGDVLSNHSCSTTWPLADTHSQPGPPGTNFWLDFEVKLKLILQICQQVSFCPTPSDVSFNYFIPAATDCTKRKTSFKIRMILLVCLLFWRQHVVRKGQPKILHREMKSRTIAFLSQLSKLDSLARTIWFFSTKAWRHWTHYNEFSEGQHTSEICGSPRLDAISHLDFFQQCNVTNS